MLHDSHLDSGPVVGVLRCADSGRGAVRAIDIDGPTFPSIWYWPSTADAISVYPILKQKRERTTDSRCRTSSAGMINRTLDRWTECLRDSTCQV